MVCQLEAVQSLQSQDAGHAIAPARVGISGCVA